MTAPTPNADLAYRVLDHIDAHPESWNQTVWYRQNECGTAGCFAGWAVMLAGHQIEPTFAGPNGNRSYSKIDGDSYISMQQVAERDLRIEGAEIPCHLGCGDCGARSAASTALFDAINTREDLGRLVAEIFGPRPDAADRLIDSILREGEEMPPPPCADHETNELNCAVCSAQRRAFYVALGRES